jgi:hypothetical protein
MVTRSAEDVAEALWGFCEFFFKSRHSVFFDAFQGGSYLGSVSCDRVQFEGNLGEYTLELLV